MLRSALNKLTRPLLRGLVVPYSRVGVPRNLSIRVCSLYHFGVQRVYSGSSSSDSTTTTLFKDSTAGEDSTSVGTSTEADGVSCYPGSLLDDPESEFNTDFSDDPHSLILSAALKLVPEYGWTATALAEGAFSVGLPNSKELDPSDLVRYFEQTSNDELSQYLQKLAQEQRSMSEITHAAVKYRLRMIIPYMEKWPQALSLKAFPSSLEWSLESFASIIDEIWYWAGDRSTDINWYTKRGILAGIYSSTELFMIQDGSDDFKDTWEFLNRQFDNVKEFGKATRQMQGVMKGTMEFMNLGITEAMNIFKQSKR